MKSYVYRPGRPPLLIDITPNTVNRYIRDFEFFFLLEEKDYEDNIKIRYVASGFAAGSDLETWFEGDESLLELSYIEFISVFGAKVEPIDYNFNILTSLKNAKQGKLQVVEYITVMKGFQNLIGSKVVKDSVLAGFIIDGLDKELQGLVRRNPCSVGTGLSETEIGGSTRSGVAPIGATVPLPFVFQDFEDFLKTQWINISIRTTSIHQHLTVPAPRTSSNNSQQQQQQSRNPKPPASSVRSPISETRLPTLTIRERAYLMENTGCFKCRKINLPKIGDMFHGTRNCTNGFATITVVVPNSFIPKPETTTKIKSLNLPSTLATLELQLQNYSVGEDSSADSDELVDLPFPPLKLRVGLADRSRIVKALADTGASSSFISQGLVDALGLEKVRLRKPRFVKLAIKGAKALDLSIEYYTVVPIALKNGLWEAGETFFKIANLEGWDMILGNPFLFKHRITPVLYPTPRLDRIIEGSVVQNLLAKVAGPRNLGVSLPPLPAETEEERLLFEAELILAHIWTLEAEDRWKIEEAEEAALFAEWEKKLLEEFQDVFPDKIPDVSPNDSPVRHHIKLIDPTIEIKLRGFSAPYKDRTNYRILLDEHVAAGRMRVSNSPYSSPSFIIPKKDRTVLPRWLNDFRRLNANTVKDRTPLPLPDEIISQCSKAKYWGKVDMTNSFFQTRMAEEDIAKTAVITPWGLYEWVVMPMGLCNAPATHQRRVNEALGELNGTICYAYIDDIIIFADTLEQHTDRVRLVLTALRKANLYCSPKKTQLFTNKISFLGHIISRKGVEADPGKIEKIVDWPVPRTVKQLRGFLGLVQYLRKFIVGLATHTSALTKLVRKNITKLDGLWSEEQQVHFDAIKRIVTSLPCLKPFDHSDTAEPVFVMTDASKVGIGAVLLQGVDWKNAHPVAFYSRQYISAESHYPTHEQEMLAVVASLKHWRLELLGVGFTALSKFQVLTDHETLTKFPTQPSMSKRQSRWMEVLADYDYTLKYIPGEQNTVADALSRYGFLEPEVTLATVSSVSTVSINAETLDRIKSGYTSDPFCVQVIKNLKSTPGMSLKEGLLYNEDRLVIPGDPVLRETLLHDAHDALGHLGVRKTYRSIQRIYFWPMLRKDVEIYVKSCDGCQRHKSRTTKVLGKLHALPVPRRIMTDIAIDFVGPLPRSDGYDTLMTVTCRLSGYVRLIPCDSKDTAEKMASRLYEGWHRFFGMPERIVSDRDKLFVSKFWKALHNRLGIKLQMSSAFHPETDGRSERTNKTAVQILRFMVNRSQKDWVSKLSSAEYALNVAENVATGKTPFEMVVGYVPTLIPRTELEDGVREEGVEEFIEQRESLRVEARDSLIAAKVEQAEQANAKRGEDPLWEIGEKVMIDSRDRRARYKSKGIARAAKFFPRFDGPYDIISSNPDRSSYTVQLSVGDKSFSTFHTSKLKKYIANDVTKFPVREPDRPDPVIVGGEEEYIVEEILDERKKGRGVEYLVKWEGYPETTWESSKVVEDLEALDQWEKNNHLTTNNKAAVLVEELVPELEELLEQEEEIVQKFETRRSHRIRNS